MKLGPLYLPSNIPGQLTAFAITPFTGYEKANQTSIGMNAGRIGTGRGDKWLFNVCLALSLVVLTGCQPHVLVDLVNESATPIRISYNSGGREEVKIIPSGGRAHFVGTVPVTIESNGKNRKYFLRSFPPGFVRSEIKSRVVSLAFGDDAKLYLLKPDEKPPATRVTPQPTNFPVGPES